MTTPKIALINMIQREGFVVSLSQARRLVHQGAVRLNGETIKDIDTEIVPDGQTLQVGKKSVILKGEHDNGNNNHSSERVEFEN